MARFTIDSVARGLFFYTLSVAAALFILVAAVIRGIQGRSLNHSLTHSLLMLPTVAHK
jgi:hypothetical protein